MKSLRHPDFSKILLESKKSYLIIFILGFIVYVKSLFFNFTYFDDNVLILDNLFFLRNISNFFRAFTTEVFHILHSSAAYYRPILTISYMLDALVSGENPFFYHLTNLLIHLANSILIFIFLGRLKVSKELSFFFSVVFAVHPVLAQAVVWLPGRNDSLLAFFTLLSFIFLIDFLDKRKASYLWFHFLSFALAFFTKESSILIPFLILFYGFFIFQDRKVIIKILPILFMGWVSAFFVWFYLRSIALLDNPVPYSFLGSIGIIVNNLEAVILYFGKIILPFNLSVLPILQDSTLIYGFISLLLFLVALVFSKDRNIFLVFFGILWFLILLLPSFIRPEGNMPDFLEHRVYLPLIGVFIVFSELSFFKKINFNSVSVFILLFSVVLGFSILTFFHIDKFKDRVSFWESAASTSPSHPLAHRNLGAMYYLDGKLDEAQKEFEKALEINYEEPMVHNNLGLIYLDRKDYDKAESEFNVELEFNPIYDKTLFNLGLLHFKRGNKDKAIEMWLKTIAVNPDHKDALVGLYSLYKDQGDLEKAEFYYNQLFSKGLIR